MCMEQTLSQLVRKFIPILNQTETQENSRSKFEILKDSILAVLLESSLQEGEILLV